MTKDPTKSGFISGPELFACFEKAQMQLLPREFEELASELDPSKTGRISYEQFLTAVFMT